MQRRRAIAPVKILKATNLRLEDTQVYQEIVEGRVRSLVLRCKNDYLVKLLRNVGSVSFGVLGIEIAIADLEGWLQSQSVHS
ncbi:MAG: hypothetical protein RM368_23835 [Nostoc sp. DedSLP03]|uniref:hypothetical protein n=1 Tax=Nostoc sp. DedSLP03 TaxID=3075400 RepID=UPI002AD4BA88|nr:hypothetical protein [Nostoc sp. DedSLP03]MDZ7967951.1 hypothetical protein [Nostoc sp. DedSLP03]